MTSFKAIQLIPILDLPAEVSPTKLACLDAISTTLADVSGKDKGQIKTAFLEREAVGNTALESGVVIPHAVLVGRQAPFLGILCCPDGISDWQDLDSHGVRLVLAILLGRDGLTSQEGDAIKVLFEALASPQFLDTLAQASEPQAVMTTIKNKLEDN